MFDKLRRAFQKLFGGDEQDIGIVKSTIAKIVNIRLSQAEAERISQRLFYDLLESDVPYELAEYIKGQIQRELLSRTFSEKYQDEIRLLLREILKNYIHTASIDIDRGVILLVGPNGYGKTTTAVKIAYLLKSRGKRVKVIGADVFRAAAREQLVELCSRYNIDVYTDNSDRPISTIIRGMKDREMYDFIIIDTAGRQDLNVNLLRELQNIDNKIRPDLILFVLESSVGNTSLHQLREYRKYMRIHGIVYTKTDLDTAGGSVLAAGYYGFPIYFLTNGQNVQDIESADVEKILDRIL
ncbi:MAG: AAA family ATPase [Candidatus Micrarchaeota archaeon]|nr:AAA family ATPase [Candidatus Micrarchaeota archaeon]MCX8154475.1 AAA family ATPase [Candidatus Micrarchaeota archaeon]